VDLLAIASGVGRGVVPLNAETGALFQINLFQVLIAAANFLVFLALIWTFAFKPISKILADRKARIEEGLRDAEQARRDRESAEAERVAALQEARREANEVLTRAQMVAQDSREADIAATKADLDRMRERASAEIEAEKQRAIGELRAEVADLALQAAGRVVGETMTSKRERRLVEEFLADSATGGGSTRGGSTRGGSGRRRSSGRGSSSDSQGSSKG
jgi:F-type H+-transporting ATPase subunit b